MATTVTSKGQVTIPKHLRDALSLEPGSRVTFEVNAAGEVVIRKEGASHPGRRGRFQRAIGAAEIKLGCSVDEYMEMIRGYSGDPAPESGL